MLIGKTIGRGSTESEAASDPLGGSVQIPPSSPTRTPSYNGPRRAFCLKSRKVTGLREKYDGDVPRVLSGHERMMHVATPGKGGCSPQSAT